MNPIPLGLIGVGRHGSRYLQHLLSEDLGGKLLAISRTDQEEGKILSEHHNLRFYPKWEDLVTDPDIQGVLIVTPPFLHLPMALEAMNQGKAVLVEKPLALNAHQANQMVKQAKHQHIPFMTAHTLRYEPAIIRLRQVGTTLGNWERISCTMQLPLTSPASFKPHPPTTPGVVLELGIHLLDLVHWLTQDSIRLVTADCSSSSPNTPETQATIQLKTQEGITCDVEISRTSGERITRAEIIGTEGKAAADWTAGTVHLFSEGKGDTTYPCLPRPTLSALLKDFCGALHSEEDMPITGEDGLRALELADACTQSAKTRRPIYLP